MGSGAAASADELVKFTSAGRGEAIQGYLTRPKGAGPFPAVVLLHTCLGLPANRRSIADALAAWGYVALFVDDFTTRGLKETCAVDFPEGVADAYGAHMLCDAPEHRLPAPTRKLMMVRFGMAAALRINRLVDPQGHAELWD